MPLQKQTANINFSQGLDTKTDPLQVAAGRFASLKNSIFGKGGLLQKRNGYGALVSLPDATSKTITTFNGGLTAIGTKLEAYSAGSNTWANRGSITPVGVSVSTLIRNNTNQSQVDAAVSASGLVCTVYTDQDPTSLAASIYRYAVSDVNTGQSVIAPTTISGADVDYGTPRVFLLGSYFIVVFTNKVSSTYHLKYFSINTTSLAVGSATDISTSYTPATTVNFDGAVLNNTLYIAWNGAAASGIKMATLTSTLSLSSATNPDSAHVATVLSVCADAKNSVIWVSYYNSGTSTGYTLAVNPALSSVLAATQIISSGTILNITASAQSGVLTALYEVSNNYSYDSGVASHYVQSRTCTQAGSVGTAATVLRSVGLGSKSFISGGVIYCLFAFSSPYQPTYFLSDVSGNIIAKIAYGNGGGYLTLGLPSVSLIGSIARIGYRFKDLIQAVNKGTSLAAGTQTAGIYSQTGLNLVAFDIGDEVFSAEIGSNLNLTGGFLWGYDGYTPVEQNFHLWPDSVEGATATTGGSLTAQIYYYQFVYEWTDNQGNAFRSAPSIPVKVDASGSMTSTNKNTLQVPTLRLTYKTANAVKIVGYRWSTAQQSYYQFTSLTAPTLNDITVDSVQIVDTLADATILGNNLIYTTGGVVENVGPPSFESLFLFDDRLWGVESEDRNTLWYSKQAIPSTPVEMSDLFTLFVSPNAGAQGSSGPINCGFPMDDKAILFKDSSLLYFNGSGPDNTGANGQYSQPALITSTVGCSNQSSIVFMPNGLMFEFQSAAGNQIWLLGRDLSTRYIGSAVESLTSNTTIQSAVNIPGTNQVRFTLASGITLMYDYFYNQWGSFVGVPATSSTLYQGLHTYINSVGQAFQETPGLYVDGSAPVLMSFTTSWLSLAGLQGYMRAYYFFLLGTYLSPHKLAIQIAYDYNPSPSQAFTISPDNYNGTYGGDALYGISSAFGGTPITEQWRCPFLQQKCQSFQITLTETFDGSLGTAPGAGLSLSGLDVVFGQKKGWPRLPASRQAG